MVEASAAGLPMKKDYIGFSNDRALLSLVGSGKLSENTIRPRSLSLRLNQNPDVLLNLMPLDTI